MCGMHSAPCTAAALPDLSCMAHPQEGRIPEGVLAGITAQVLAGLTYLHRHKHTVRSQCPTYPDFNPHCPRTTHAAPQLSILGLCRCADAHN